MPEREESEPGEVSGMRRTVFVVVAILLALPGHPGARPARDPLLDEQWGLAVIDAPAAWATTRGDGSLIAILDSGILTGHPDLRANVIGPGYDAIRDRVGPAPASDHGTWVAGVAAAVGGNGEGISGVAPRAKILPVRVCDQRCPPKAIVRGIRYAIRRGADVINMSFYVPKIDAGTPPVLDAVADARRAGIVVVAAAGNSTEPWCVEPAASALCVGATDRSDRPTTYSNRDAAMQSRFLVAPGGSGLGDCAGMIVSTVPRAVLRACPAGPDYAYSTGTSGASPFVAGVAALLTSLGASNEVVEDCILSGADDLGPQGRDPVFGYGRLDAADAVRCAQRAV